MTVDNKPQRLSKLAKELNVATTTIVEFLHKQGFEVEENPNTKIEHELVLLVEKQFKADKEVKEKLEKIKQKEEEEKRLREADVEEEVFEEELEVEENEINVEKKSEEHAELAVEAEVKEESEIKQELDVIEEKSEETVTENVPENITIEVEQAATEETTETLDSTNEQAEASREESLEEEESEDIGLKIIDYVDPETLEVKGKKPRKKKTEPEEKIEESQPASDDEKGSDVIEEAPEEKKEEIEKISASDSGIKFEGLKIVGKIEVEDKKPPKEKQKKGKKGGVRVISSDEQHEGKKIKTRKLKKKTKKAEDTDWRKKEKGKKAKRPAVDQKQVKKNIRETLGSAQAQKPKKYKKDKTAKGNEITVDEKELEVIEFITVKELASLMDVDPVDIISICFNVGYTLTINQRLDAEIIEFVASEFGYKVKFKDDIIDEEELEEPDVPERMVERAPVVTIMGHVDHGKTSLLDYIRKSRITEKEAGGITQHLGAYEVVMPESGKKIVFLDTPGHEAFTAMRARGAKVTDIVIIVVAADDSVMPQTKEAISHAQAAGVPIIFAINKIDKPGANPNRIKQQLAEMNILVEELGGEYLSQEISAKQGTNVDKLLESVLMVAELLELKADPEKKGVGTVLESKLDKGRGIITNVLIQKGKVKVGDPVLAGAYHGKVKSLINEKGEKVKEVGPSTPIEILGFDGTPNAGDKFYVVESERKAKEIALKRQQLLREQGMRAVKHITLEEIGRRIKLGNFKELNVIIKGDVDGSVEALADEFLKLSNEEVQVNIIHKAVGMINESDVLLAASSEAIIIGFQVRPSLNARKLAEKEQIQIRTYSVIYDAIDEMKSAIEGMLSPTEEEKIVCTVEVRQVFKISKVGMVAGCFVLDGKITRNTQVRVLREGVVIYTGEIASLKRYKDDVKEVSAGYECGIVIKNFNDVKVGDIIEGFEKVQIKRTL